MPFWGDFKVNGEAKILRVARKMGYKTSQLVEENKLNGVCGRQS